MKISEYPSYSNLQPTDLFLVVANVNSDPVSKKMQAKDLFGGISSNTSITGNFSVTGDISFSGNNYSVTTTHVTYQNVNIKNLVITSNGFIVQQKFTPANSSVYEASSEGKISFDDNYIYVKTSNNSIKRVALTSF